MSPKESDATLREQIRSMRPWHHNIPLNENLSTGDVFTNKRRLLPSENDGVSLISPRIEFRNKFKGLFPGGMAGVRFLDCACNAGAYCFFARELGADFAFGFDVRKHWIDQAKFVQEHRVAGPTDRIEFREMDLNELANQQLEPFDFTFFSGILYHLPDPIAGLKAAADLTTDILLLNTAGVANSGNPYGMSLISEGIDPVMSGVHQLAWFPNSAEVMVEVLRWLGFKEMKITKHQVNEQNRLRFEIIAAREEGRLKNMNGQLVKSKVIVRDPTAPPARNVTKDTQPTWWQRLRYRIG